MTLSRPILPVVLLSACGGPDAARPPDAPTLPAALACLDDPPPATAPPEVSVSSRIRDTTTGEPVAGVAYEIVRRSDDSVAGTALTAADGSVTTTAPTGGGPLDAYVRYGKAGYATFYNYFAHPLVTAVATEDGITTPADYRAGFPPDLPPDPAAGVLQLAVRDCDGMPLQGAEVTLTPPAARVVGEATDAFALNVPAGPVEIAATYQGIAVPPVAVAVHAGSVTYLEMRP